MNIYEINKLLSSENKSKIISHFWNCQCGAHTVADICGKLDLTQPNLSKHLGILLKFNVLNVEQKGKERYYSISQDFKNEWKDIIEPQIRNKSNAQWACHCSEMRENVRKRM